MQDKFGRDFSEDDWIVYAKSSGRSSVLGFGKVLSVSEKDEKLEVNSVQGIEWGDPDNNYSRERLTKIYLRRPHTIVIIEPSQKMINLYM